MKIKNRKTIVINANIVNSGTFNFQIDNVPFFANEMIIRGYHWTDNISTNISGCVYSDLINNYPLFAFGTDLSNSTNPVVYTYLNDSKMLELHHTINKNVNNTYKFNIINGNGNIGSYSGYLYIYLEFIEYEIK